MREPSIREADLHLKAKFLKGALAPLGSRGPIKTKLEWVGLLHSAARRVENV